MAAVLREMKDGYIWIMNDLKDPRTTHFYLQDSFPTLVFLAVAYVYIATNLGPKLMENRKAFKLKEIMAAYNIMQIVSCAYVVLIGYPLFWRYDWTCAEVPEIGEDMTLELEIGFIYYTMKFVDLLDTLFFILRKKQNQISFLHVMHHTGMILAGWIGLKFVPGGQTFYVAFINTFVHLVMYSYYLITGLSENSKKNIWWKKYLTQLQLTQFVIMVVIFTSTIVKPGCKYPWIISFYVVIQNVCFLAMFSQYYYHAFLSKKSKQKI